MRFPLFVLCVLLMASPLYATVGQDAEAFTESPAAPLLTGTNVLMTVVNGMQVAGDGSYLLGVLGILSGAATFALASSYDDSHSRLVEAPAALSIAAGALSIIRRRAAGDAQTVSLEPAVYGLGYGACLKIRF